MKNYLKVFLGFVFVFSFFVLLPNYSNAGWTEQTGSGSRSWSSIASDSTGQYLAAVASAAGCGGSCGPYYSIYTSDDFGAMWTEQTGSGQRNWKSITSSSNGQYLAAVVMGGYIYTSNDFGATWLQKTSDATRNWKSITSSSTGQYLAAVVVGGYIYTSNDFGATWLQKTSDAIRGWYSVTSNSTGQYLAAVVVGGYIYTSNDFGATWLQKTSDATRSWKSITSSSNGQYLAAVVYSGYIYTSNDFGATWLQKTSDARRGWSSIASDSTGQYLAAVVGDPSGSTVGYIYTSVDTGNIWIEQTSSDSRNWVSITSSSDGTKLAAVVEGGYIYTYPLPEAPDTTPNNFTLTDQTGITLSTGTESNTITIAGINTSTPISISCTGVLCEYKINSGTYTASPGTVVNGDTITVRQASSDTENTTTDAILDIGGVTDTFSITTGDFTNPVITLTGESTINIYAGNTYTDQGATATDNIDGNITSSIVTVNNVNTNTTGTYIITYNVDDTAGNHATEVTRTVNVNKRPSSGSTMRIQPKAPIVLPSTPTTTPPNINTITVTKPLITKTLKLNTRNNEVKDLQVYLNAKGYTVSDKGAGSKGNETNFFGPKTKQALIRFQLANGLKGDGVLGPVTLLKMR